MRKILWVVLVCLSANILVSQIDSSYILTEGYFINPVDHTMKLSGSFGELRSNHFHAGIDIKSKNVAVGDTIRAAAEGYISRIKMQRGSYGQVLYIDHPNGYTTVYAHMQKFSPDIQQYIKDRQREAQSYEVDVYPSIDKMTVKQGQYIGNLGNTGRSYGPHLHFEIRNTKSEIPQNPYLHGLGPQDSKSPLLYAVAAQGFDKDLMPVSSEVKYISETKSAGNYGPVHIYKVPAWRAGLSIQAFDQMDGANNKNGVYHLKMYVDDTLHYEVKVDSVDWGETKYINSFMDYAEKKNNNRTLIRCYRQKANPLSLYKTMKNNGFFKIYENKPRDIRFEALDFYGNISTYECKVLRVEADSNIQPKLSYVKKISYDQHYDFKVGITNLEIPAGTTDNTLYLHYDQQLVENKVQLEIGKKDEPIFKRIGVTVPLKNIPPHLRNKVVLANMDGKTPTSYGGELLGDSITAKIDRLGKYNVLVDTISPEITPLEYKKSARGRSDFKFRLKDNFNTRGAAADVKYDVYIDDIWHICPLKAYGDVLTVPLNSVNPGQHTIRIQAIDHSGNKKQWTSSFSN